jgi:hypothetical protein
MKEKETLLLSCMLPEEYQKECSIFTHGKAEA